MALVEIKITDGATTGRVFSKAIDDNFTYLNSRLNIVSGTTSAAQIQSDWTQANTGALDYIKHKPNIPAAQIQSDWTQASTGATDFIKHKPDIPPPQVQSDWNAVTGLGVILNKPIISGATEVSQADWAQASTGATDYIKHKPLTFAPSAHIHPESDVTGLVSDLAGKSGTGHTHNQYATIVNFNSHTGNSSIHFTQGSINISQSQVTGLVTSLAGKSGTGHTHTESQITNLVSDLAGKSGTGHTHAGLYEPLLSHPLTGGTSLVSATNGVKSWVNKATVVNGSFTGIYVLTAAAHAAIVTKDPNIIYFTY